MKQLPPAQLRVLRAVANCEIITGRYGAWLSWRPFYRHDSQIFRKLVARGYLVSRVVRRRYGFVIEESLTDKGWRACGISKAVQP